MTDTFVYASIIAAFLFASCNRGGEATDAAPHGGGSVTQWTTKSELFMEYPALIVGKESRFAVHLTRLSDFTSVDDGGLSLVFTSSEGNQRACSVDKPASPGIFRPTITFTHPGTYHLAMIVDGAFRDTLHVEGIRVYSSMKEIPAEEQSQGEQLITFLKEQQWKTDFRTEPVRRMRMTGTVRAVCEIMPKLNREAIVSAPFTGTIPAEGNDLPTIGRRVNRGDPLATMIPSAETPGGVENFYSRFIEAKSDRELAERELDRAKQLFSKGLISEREYQEEEAEFRQADATYRALGRNVQVGNDGQSFSTFTLRAPLSGIITEAHVVPGMQFDAGASLYRIIDTRLVWIRADVASTEIGKLTRPKRAWMQLPGVDERVEINERNGSLVSIATVIDPATRTFPVIFEVRNDGARLKVGLFGEISIATGTEKESLVIPESALIEEEGRYSVYVHVEGEAFAKRDVTLGERNGDAVEILSGVAEGERIVSVGAYQVRLASLSSQIPEHGHTH